MPTGANARLAPDRESRKKRRRPLEGPAPGDAGVAAGGGRDYFEMSTSLVSRRNSMPTTSVMPAMMIGYHKPL